MSKPVKVTVNQSTPSQQATEDARKTHEVTDAKGRVLTLKKPNVLAQFRLVKILGDAARNATYMQLVTPLTYLVAIDGEEVIQPRSDRELDALIGRLDDEGVMAIMDNLPVLFGTGSQADQEQALKNS
jgi:hypothetical protein